MHDGYVKLYRKLMKNPVWQDPLKLKLWLLCLMKASYKKRKIMIGTQMVSLDKGEFVTGRDSLEAEFNRDMQKKYQVSGRTLLRWLDFFETQGYLTIKPTNKYSVITINNWDVYNKIDQQLSSNSPEFDLELSANKKGKNGKNIKKPSKSTNNQMLLDELVQELLGGNN